MPPPGTLRPAVTGARALTRMAPAGHRCAAGLLLLTAGCGGGADGVPVTPSAPATPAAATVSFAERTDEVREGAAAQVGIGYRTSGLSAPVTLRITASGGSATEDDYRLPVESLEIPAGETTTGELTFAVETFEDDWFAEGKETLVLTLEAPPGSRVQVDGRFELIIAEAGVRPCRGIMLSGEPPHLYDRWESEPAIDTETATIRLTLETETADVVFDWVGPYRDYHLDAAWNPSFRVRNVDAVTQLDQNLVHWSFEPTAAGVRHTIEFESLAHLEAGFRFRSETGACAAEPEAVCTGAGCELRP